MDHCFSPHLEPAHAAVEINADLQRHLDALRLRDGDAVQVFNGRGLIATCTVQRSGTTTTLSVAERTTTPEPTPLILAIGGLDHRDRFEFAVEKAVELGATSIVPIDSTRVQRFRSNADRLEAKAIAAATQSGNPWLPDITKPLTLAELLVSLPDDHRILLGDPDGGVLDAASAQEPVCCLVGPEGGFTDDELQMVTADARTARIAIGRLRLRAETAGIALLSVVRSLRD